MHKFEYTIVVTCDTKGCSTEGEDVFEASSVYLDDLVTAAERAAKKHDKDELEYQEWEANNQFDKEAL